MRAVALRAIFDDAQPPPPRQPGDRLHIGGLAVEMHRQHRGRATRRGRIQRPFERGGVDRKPARLDIDQHRHGAGPLDRGDGRNRRVRDGKDQIAGADAAGPQRQLDRVGAAAGADRVPGPEPGRKRLFERCDLAAENVLPAFQHAGNRGVDLGLRFDVTGARVGLRDRRMRHDLSKSADCRCGASGRSDQR